MFELPEEKRERCLKVSATHRVWTRVMRVRSPPVAGVALHTLCLCDTADEARHPGVWVVGPLPDLHFCAPHTHGAGTPSAAALLA
jgi:hypothetical protein